jgi:intracellular septation protein
MTDPRPGPQAQHGAQLLIDLGPTALFVIAYNVLLRIPATEESAVYYATATFIAATLLAIGYSLWKTGRVAPVLIVTGVIVTTFGGLTIALHDPTFIQLKPTALNWFFAAALAGSVLIKQNAWRLMFGHAFNLPDRIWKVLALRWAGFFVCMGVVNEILRHMLTTQGWVTWHFPALFTPTVLFAMLNAPLMLKHHVAPSAEPSR